MDAECRRLGRTLQWRGTVVLAVFALVWAAAGASSITSGPAVAVIRITAATLTLTAIGLAVRVARGTQRPQRPRSLPDGWNRRIGLVNIVQLVVIGATVVALVRADASAYLPAAVCLIVGIHFFPLARYYDQAQYSWLGVGLCLVSVAGFVSLTVAAAQSRTIVGFGAAAVLWGTALHVAIKD